MALSNNGISSALGWILALVVMGAVAATLTLTRDRWLPTATSAVEGVDSHAHQHADHGHDHAAHDHAGHDDASSLELDEKAWKNIGLTTAVVRLQDFQATVAVPALVVERPGRSQVTISAPLTGVVTRVHPLEGQAVEPGDPLFDIRLTHEDMVTAQSDFLRSLEELAVVEREIGRLESVGEGVVAGRRVLEQEYRRQEIQGALRAQRQALILHGLSEDQIDRIVQTRQLQQSVTVVAPEFSDDYEHAETSHWFHVQTISVSRGQHVAAGETLGVLADHCLLYVEGQAFENDAAQLVAAARSGTKVRVSTVTGEKAETLKLEVVYVADHVDAQSRALRFYLRLTNELVHETTKEDRRFVAWRHRPGQRMEVHLPTAEKWEGQLVLPPQAVVDEGAETFVFEQNGDHFDRVAVHVLYRGRDAVVVENDGTLVGATLAMSGAYQMHLAIKNKAGGAVDPHAGHQH